VRFEAVLLAESPYASTHPEIGGAYVNAWINYVDPWGSIELAKTYARHEGWTDTTSPAISKVDRVDCKPDEIECYDAAVEHGYHLDIFTWEKDDADA
jgi:hypothetical protein